ncbi:MAG: glycosyltransferase [Sporolactobacillus sp.]
MKRVMAAFVRQSEKNENIMQLLKQVDGDGVIVHLYNIKQDETLTSEHLNSVYYSLVKKYSLFNFLVFSNDYSFILQAFEQQIVAVDGFYLFLEDYSFPTEVKRSFFQKKVSIVRPIQLIVDSVERALPFIIHYLPYVKLNLNNKLDIPNDSRSDYNQLSAPEKTDIYRVMSSFFSSHYIPKEISALFLLQYYDNRNEIDKELKMIYSVQQYLSNATLENSFENFIEQLGILMTNRPKIALWSLAYEATKDKKYILKMLNKNFYQSLQFQEKYSLYVCLKRIDFVGQVKLNLNELGQLRWFYNDCVDELAGMLDVPSDMTSTSQTNHVVIFSSQILGLSHSPTRQVMDYALSLKKLGNEVFIINSQDVLTQLYVPFFDGFAGNVIEEFSNLNTIEYEKETFKFFQPKQPMPNIQEAQKMVNLVKQFNPQFVISMGDSAVGDLCSSFTTVISMVFGGNTPKYRKTYWAITRRMTAEDSFFMEKFQIKKEYVLPVQMAFLKKEKQGVMTREKLSIPLCYKVLAVVGNRLDDEVTTAFLVELKTILEQIDNTYILFIGPYADYSLVVSKYPILKKRSKNTGYVQDIQSVYSCCDFYINPHRKGGGSSAAEAMSEGLPVITDPNGDVYNQLWMEQSFTDINEVIKYLCKCIEHPLFYREEKEKCLDRARTLFDSVAMMKKISHKVSKLNRNN